MNQRGMIIALSILSLTFCFCLFLFKSAGSSISRSWKLSGKEILLELCGGNEEFPHGIYALDPFTPKPKLRLLLKGGRRPVWSPKRRFVAYIESNDLWISDRNGNATRTYTGAFLSNLGFHDPPVIWTWKEGFLIVWRLSSWGGLIGYAVENPPKDGNNWDAFVPTPIIPLKRRLPEDPDQRKIFNIQWEDFLCFNNPTCSPDGKLVAAEVYPSGPEDLRRAESKIFIYERCPAEEMELWWEWRAQTFRGKGKRLTNLGEDVTELRPLWSPTGEWIAFTAVRWKEGYVAPAVIRPDGNDYTELLSRHAPYATLSLGDKWEPVTPLDVKDPQRLPENALYLSFPEWGRPHVYPVEWSEDGKYLLLNMGKRCQNLQVAKWEDGKWWVMGVGGHMGYGFGGLKFVAWGVGRFIAIVPDGGGMIGIVEIGSGKFQWIYMPDEVWIEWMDW